MINRINRIHDQPIAHIVVDDIEYKYGYDNRARNKMCVSCEDHFIVSAAERAYCPAYIKEHEPEEYVRLVTLNYIEEEPHNHDLALGY